MDGTATPDLDPRFARPRTLFFGIGAQKAATSWLDTFLRGHPEVCLPVRKEQHYWTTMRLPGASDRRARVAWQVAKIEQRSLAKRLFRAPRKRLTDQAWRLNQAMLREDQKPGHRAYADVLFQAWRGEPVAGEITPAYALLESETFAEMAGLAGDVRFVFIMRDPVARLVSATRMNMRKRHRSDGPRPKPLSFEHRMAEVVADPANTGLLRSRYDLTIQRMEAVVPRERIAYFFFEELFRQPEIDRLTDFLGVTPLPAPFAQKVNSGARRGSGVMAKPLDAGLEAQAMAALAPTYAFVRERFGPLVPEGWRTPSAALAASA